MDDNGGLGALAARIYALDDPNRKPAFYLTEYERLFRGLRDKPINLLELGVQRGASMQLWREYFPAATVVGLDIARPRSFPGDKRFHFIRGSQDDPKILDLAIAAGGPFDIVLDDASHIGSFTGRSFAYLFPRALKPGGIYIIEDIATGFLPQFDGVQPVLPEIGVADAPKIFASHLHGNIGLVKQIVDHAMVPAVGLSSPFMIEKILLLPSVAIIIKASPGSA
jgi:SAM-dependent methyltransferase